MDRVQPLPFSRHAALAGIVVIVSACAVVGLMHVTGPSALLSPTRHTISAYAHLENGWLFNTAVLVLAIGSLGALAGLVGTRLCTLSSGASLGLLLWSVSLAAVVYFPKHNWSVGPSVDGDIHRVASIAAFVSLPIGALLVARAWLTDPRWRRHARRSFALGALSLLWFTPIVGAVLLEPYTGVRWWRAIPLGAVERGLVCTEIVTLLALGWWAVRAAAPAPVAGTVAELSDRR